MPGERLRGLRTERDRPAAATLADHVADGQVEVDVVDREGGDLAQAAAGVEEQADDRGVTAVAGVEERANEVVADDLGRAVRGRSRGDLGHRIDGDLVLADESAEAGAQGSVWVCALPALVRSMTSAMKARMWSGDVAEFDGVGLVAVEAGAEMVDGGEVDADGVGGLDTPDVGGGDSGRMQQLVCHWAMR
nr:hypothetical protein [Actinophytocola oryzae]